MAFGRNLAILGLIPFAFGAYASVMGMLTLRWPRAAASIIGCERHWSEGDRRNIGSADSPKGWSTARLSYSYSVAGVVHTGTGVDAYTLGLVNAAHEDRLCSAYQPHQQVAVAYDPDAPGISYLEPGASLSALMLLGVGSVMLLSGWRVRVLASRGLGRMNADGATETIERQRGE
ncbi:DUF3592 domain-containing protein [Bosea sp. CS1GBMeth4]|uniref:DUF3592 domain-containing protein n=1 Tax=Bosea sp. CS1GBMeth4 TaxID=1892849 RepID=UPI0016445E4B|nr:DUF3592 domain-containing protein [Bosea sp. CS1GBMeth4]